MASTRNLLKSLKKEPGIKEKGLGLQQSIASTSACVRIKSEPGAVAFDNALVIKREHQSDDDEEGPPKTKIKTSPVKRKLKNADDEEGPPKTKIKTSPVKRKLKNAKVKCAKKIKLESGTSDSTDSNLDWNVAEELANHLDVSLNVSRNIIHLIEQDNTIPFIARYRKEKTGDMDAANLRNFVESYETLKSVQAKAHTMIQTVEKTGKLSQPLLKAFQTTRSMEELEHLYAPFKTNKKSLAERAKLMGLDKLAMAFLNDPSGPLDFSKYVEPTKDGLATVQDVKKGVQHIIADIIAKDYSTLKFVQEKYIYLKEIISEVILDKILQIKLIKCTDENFLALMFNSSIFLQSHMQIVCKQRRISEKKLKDKESIDKDEANKFETYFNFCRNVKSVQSHQVMAINRGENHKILSVKVEIPDFLKQRFFHFVSKHFCKSRTPSSESNRQLINLCIKDAYDRFIEPLVCRKMRSDLTKNAEKQSVEVFATNLRNLLLASPIQGKVIAAIDPGFSHGCKMAVVAPNGDVLHTETLYLHNNSRGYKETQKLAEAIQKFRCTIIGIGNGTACRQTESVVTQLIRNSKFHPMDVVYCIVNESGVSVYSVSDDAATEFPDMDPNQRSAVSLARRLLDPLSEHVKVEPKHLGIGMYQHDISESLLKRSLDSVVEECVSFTGVDVNVCSKSILSKVAGMTIRKAEAIIDWRKENGAFVNLEQIQSVTGIGPKTFEQCAGFLRILPKTLEHCLADIGNPVKKEPAKKNSRSKKKSAEVNCVRNFLDATCIHPESYGIALKVISAANCDLASIGSAEFIATMKRFLSEEIITHLSNKFKVGIPTMRLIADGLQRELDYDMRAEFSQPLFKQGIRDMNSLEVGMQLSGKVMNVASFGVFVDIGVGKDGLIHISQMRPDILRGQPLSLGETVEVKVGRIDQKKGHISLSLMAVKERSKVALH